MVSHLDRNGLEILSAEQCLALLGKQGLGRVALNAATGMTILPIWYGVDDNSVVFNTSFGAKLWEAIHDQVVAFETDYVDEARRTAWSVTARGRATRVTDEEDMVRLASMGLNNWVVGRQPDWVRIVPEMLSGRRLPLDSGGTLHW